MNDYSEYIGKHFIIDGEWVGKIYERLPRLAPPFPEFGKIKRITEILDFSDDKVIRVIFHSSPPYDDLAAIELSKKSFLEHAIIADTESESLSMYRLMKVVE